MTYVDHRTLSIEYPYQAHGARRFAIGLGLALVAWGRKRSAYRPAVTYQQQLERHEAAHRDALRFGGIR